jgi:chorismate mutase/prephenate dehydratase
MVASESARTPMSDSLAARGPMARKSPAERRPVTGSGSAAHADGKRAPTLPALRSEIDRIDTDLVKLLNRRAELVLQIGQLKQKHGLDIWSPAREEEVIARALAASRGPLPESTLRLIFRELMSGSRALQGPIRVAYLGPKYSYSHLAAVAKLGEAVEHVPVGSIAAVFEEVNRRHVQYGIVPLENSTDGRITDTLEMFVRLPGMKICAEVKLRVHHCLLGRGEWGQVQRVYSKAQALSQCRHWLGKNLPQARIIDVVSTAAAAEYAQREEFAAAVASSAAGAAYGLKVLAANIEDQPHNITRFAVIGERSGDRTGRDKTTLILRLANQAGALSKAILPFEKNGVNLTWIESFPVASEAPNRDPNYLFFLDVDGHANDAAVQRTLELVRKRCDRLEILGSYPRTESVET